MKTYAVKMFLVCSATCIALLGVLTARAPVPSVQADTAPHVTLDISTVGPRSMEDLTEHSIARDYSYAWQTLADALGQNSPELLNSYFVGAARRDLASRIQDQIATGTRSRYFDQSHSVKAVFYAPEGDAVELHDAVTCELQVATGGKSIYDQRAVLRYVVLMTPGADRWVVRQLQEVPNF
jgi:hypothetical protein